MTTRLFGSGIRRREDPRLITGQAAYTDDIKLAGLVHAAILRSPHAHARLRSVDTAAAAQAPGVLAVYTGADTAGVLNPMPCAWIIPDSEVKAVAYPPMAQDTVRYVGDAVAVVVAENRYQAEDALELIRVDYEPLPAVVNPEAALQEGAPQLHPDAPNNQAFHWIAAGGDTDAAFADPAAVVVRDTIIQQKLIPNPMEPRSAIASYLPAMGELTLWNTSQNPHIARFITCLVTGIPEHKIRVIAPEVGGGFGSKNRRLSLGNDCRLLRDEVGPAGQVDRNPVGELCRHDPRPRSCGICGNGGDPGRAHYRRPQRGLCRNGRLSLYRRPGHSHYPARADVFRPLRYSPHQSRYLRLLYQHHPRSKPIAGPAGPKPLSCWNGWSTCWRRQ